MSDATDMGAREMDRASGRRCTRLQAVLLIVAVALAAAIGARPLRDLVTLNWAYLQLAKYAAGQEPAALSAGEQLSQLLRTGCSGIQTEATIGLAFLALGQGDPEVTLSLLADLPPHGRVPLGSLWRGHALLATGRLDEAAETWAQAGVTSDYVIGYAELTGSQDWYSTAALLFPTSHTYGLIGTAYRRAGRLSEALLALETAVDLDSGWADAGEPFRVRYQLALSTWANRDQSPERAESALQDILQEAEDHYPSTLPNIYLRLGTLAEETGDYRRASDWYERLVGVSATPENFVMLGQALYLATGDFESARPEFDIALTKSASDPDALLRICRFLDSQGELAERRAYCGLDPLATPSDP